MTMPGLAPAGISAICLYTMVLELSVDEAKIAIF